MKKCNGCEFLKIHHFNVPDEGVWYSEECTLHKFKLFCSLNKNKKTKKDKDGSTDK